MFAKKPSAQAALEYLMTYGWALVIIVSIASALFFVLQAPSQDIVFSSDSRSFIVRSSNVTPVSGLPSSFVLEIQNASGRPVVITGLEPVNFDIAVPVNCSSGSTCSYSASLPSGQTTKITGNIASNYGSSGSIRIHCLIDNYSRTIALNAKGKNPDAAVAVAPAACFFGAPNGNCEPGENCPSDSGSCAPQTCKTASCTNGCVYSNEPNGTNCRIGLNPPSTCFDGACAGCPINCVYAAECAMTGTDTACGQSSACARNTQGQPCQGGAGTCTDEACYVQSKIFGEACSSPGGSGWCQADEDCIGYELGQGNCLLGLECCSIESLSCFNSGGACEASCLPPNINFGTFGCSSGETCCAMDICGSLNGFCAAGCANLLEDGYFDVFSPCNSADPCFVGCADNCDAVGGVCKDLCDAWESNKNELGCGPGKVCCG
ncbi:MAG: hypothetical protein PHH08_03730 [Candidatus ainarchaeum sp.]|nr:hypothetical protein [Candidatus ainarchaeum sp.]